MPHDPSGPCIVCGCETTHRCSPCAEHGFDLFLCGREHQKLIWFAHKRVCGVNSNPFRFPPLTEEEIEETLEKKDQQNSDGNSISALLTDIPPMTKELVPSVIRALGLNVEHLSSPHQSGVSAMRCLIRGALARAELDDAAVASSPPRSDPQRTLGVLVSNIITHKRQTASWLEYRRPFREDEGLYRRLFHLLLVYSAVFAIVCTSPNEPRRNLVITYLSQVVEQMQRVVVRTASMNEEVAADMGHVVFQLPTLSDSAE